ncbi:MAG: phosphotransferase [Roseomonas sp.]|nr:phosphotransferase [Roseomonas sp.]
MKTLRLVFIEDDPRVAEQLKPHYTKLLIGCGYSVEFFDAQNELNARKIIDTQDPHGFICDLGFDKDYGGLHLIRALRISYPDLFVIGTSMGGYTNSMVDTRQPTFHMFLDKQAILGGDARYIKLSQERFLVQFKLETALRISNIDTILGEEFHKPAAKRELVGLIRQIMFAGHAPDDLMHPDEVALEPMSGGFSGSQVFKMISRNSKSGIVCIPSVLKVSKREFAAQELENYHRFVKWGLPYTWRVDVLGYGETKNYGAIAYSFILSDLKKFESLTDLLRRKDDDGVMTVIRTLFSPEMRRWYGDPLIRSEENIVERYANRYFRGVESKGLSEKTFLLVAQKEFAARLSGNKIEISGKSYELPSPALFGRPMNKYLSCICHGDLNSNNVMVASNGQVIFIDFQETGRGHVFEDFVTMEASVRLYHGDENLRGLALLEAEQAIREGDDVAGLTGAARIAAEIRRLARSNFPSESFETYYYASASFNFRLLRAKQLTSGQASRAVAAVLAALNDLAGFRRS